jgi:hypothetical protein
MTKKKLIIILVSITIVILGIIITLSSSQTPKSTLKLSPVIATNIKFPYPVNAATLRYFSGSAS